MDKIYSEFRLVKDLENEHIIQYEYFLHMCIKGTDKDRIFDPNKNQYKAIIIMEQLLGGSLSQ